MLKFIFEHWHHSMLASCFVCIPKLGKKKANGNAERLAIPGYDCHVRLEDSIAISW
jgi:hypothetical protein